MATIQSIVDRCRLELIDTSGTPRWTDPEFLGFYNQFLVEVATLAADRVAVVQNLNFAAGVKQTLPSTIRLLLAIERNANGRACAPFNRESLQRFDPDWTTATPVAYVSQYDYDPSTPRVVYVNPPLSGPAVVEARVVPVLPAAADLANIMAIAEDLFPAVFNYMLFRACAKEAEDTAMAAKSAAYYQRMTQILGGAQ